MKFFDLGISRHLLEAVRAAGYDEPTLIQEKVIPYMLQGRDILASAQTGSGKTAAFLLPLLDMLERRRGRKRMPRALILEPTRELAMQVQEVMEQLGRFHDLEAVVLIGGESLSAQREALESAPDILIATPGRLLDHFERGAIIMSDTRFLVVDEADRMLDMGFLPDVQRIITFLPQQRQTLLFSATFPKDIQKLSEQFMKDVKKIETAPTSSASQDVKHYLSMVGERDKQKSMVTLLRSLKDEIESGIVFCNRKRDIADLVKILQEQLNMKIAALHGDMPQQMRIKTLDEFREGTLRLLVASDVVARGIDIQGIGHIFLYDIPTNAEDYIHRSGRTGRAGRHGKAYSLATPKDAPYVDAIKELLARGKQKFEQMSLHKTNAKPKKSSAPQNRKKRDRGQNFLPAFLMRDGE